MHFLSNQLQHLVLFEHMGNIYSPCVQIKKETTDIVYFYNKYLVPVL